MTVASEMSLMNHQSRWFAWPYFILLKQYLEAGPEGAETPKGIANMILGTFISGLFADLVYREAPQVAPGEV